MKSFPPVLLPCLLISLFISSIVDSFPILKSIDHDRSLLLRAISKRESDHKEVVEQETSLISLPQYLRQKKVDQELFKIICSTAAACIDVSQELQSLPIQKYVQKSEDKEIKVNIQGEKQKEMDVISNEIFIDRIRDTVVVMASEEEEYVIKGELWDDFHAEKNDYIGYEIAFDPLDGSSNLDVNVPTG